METKRRSLVLFASLLSNTLAYLGMLALSSTRVIPNYPESSDATQQMDNKELSVNSGGPGISNKTKEKTEVPENEATLNVFCKETVT